MNKLHREIAFAVRDAVADWIRDVHLDRIKDETRVDTGAMKASTRVETSDLEPTLDLIQGSVEVEYAIFIELKYGDFSRSIQPVISELQEGFTVE